MVHYRNWILAILAAIVSTSPAACAFQTAAPPSNPAANTAPVSPDAPTDPILTAAQDLIGKALFLRSFYLSNNLSYDDAGKIEGAPKSGDWTIAAINVLKAARLSPGEIELEGVRAAIRYNSDAREFQRHPLIDEKMKLLVKLAPGPDGARGLDHARGSGTDPDAGASQLRAAFTPIFAIGIDPALQHSMPPLWTHYFDPSLAWPPDPLTSETIYPMYGQPGQPQDVAPPTVAHKVNAQFTDFAARDKVKGQVQLRMVIDAEGIPRRITVTRPLGYGLEQQAADALAKWRFNPAVRAGLPVAAAIVVNLDFETAPPPH